MTHAFFYPTPENADKLDANEYAKHKLENLSKVSDGALKVEISGLPDATGELNLLWELEGQPNSMHFTVDIDDLTTAILTAMDFDRFANVQSMYEDVRGSKDADPLLLKIVNRQTPAEDADIHIWKIERLQDGFRRLIDGLEYEKAKTSKFKAEKKAAEDIEGLPPMPPMGMQ